MLDGLDRRDMGAGVAEALDAAGDVLQPAFQPPHGRIDLATRQGRFDGAAEFGDAHFQALHGLRAVVGLERAAERGDFVAERVEPVAVGHGAQERVELRGDSLVAVFERAKRRLAGAALDHGAHGLEVFANGGKQAPVERLLGGERVDALSDVEHRAVALHADAADRRDLVGKVAEVGAECRHGGAERLLIAAHGERLGAVVDGALMGGNLADGGGELRLLPGLLPLAVALRETLADLGEALLDAQDVLHGRGWRGGGRHRLGLRHAAVEARLGVVDAFLERPEGCLDDRGLGRRRRGSRRGAGLGGRRPGGGGLRQQGVQAGANFVERQRARFPPLLLSELRLSDPLLHGGDAPVELADGLIDARGIQRARSRNRCPTAQAFDHRTRLLVGVVDLACEIPDHDRDLLEEPCPLAFGPRRAGETADMLLDDVEPPRQGGDRRARGFVHAGDPLGERLHRAGKIGGGPRLVAPRRRFGGRVGVAFAEHLLQPFRDRQSGEARRLRDRLAGFRIDALQIPRQARFHRQHP